jgi:hypothetical protein
LNKEQFAIAMWLIKQKLNGIDPPANLTPEMVPPSVRKVGETIVVILFKYYCDLLIFKVDYSINYSLFLLASY